MIIDLAKFRARVNALTGKVGPGQSHRVNDRHFLPKQAPAQAWSDLHAAGVHQIGERDDLFVYVALPKGWEIKIREIGSKWYDLLDNKQRCRAVVFYQRGFNNREAYMNLRARFELSCVWAESDRSFHYEVRDCGQCLYSSRQLQTTLNAKAIDASGLNQLRRKDAVDWLEERFPLWRDARAYWN